MLSQANKKRRAYGLLVGATTALALQASWALGAPPLTCFLAIIVSMGVGVAAETRLAGDLSDFGVHFLLPSLIGPYLSAGMLS